MFPIYLWPPVHVEPLSVEIGESPVLLPGTPQLLIIHTHSSPSFQATVRVEPLSVEIGESPVLRSTVGMLGEVVK